MQVKVPAVGESITEATIAEWAKADGEYCERDEVILVLETDKASVDVVAEKAGVLSIKVEEGETVEIGAVVGEIDTEAEGAAKSAAPAAETSSAPAAAAPAAGKEVHADLKGHLSPAVSKIVADKGLDPSQISGTGKDGRLVKADVMNATPAAKAPAASNGKGAELPPMPVGAKGPVEPQTRKPMSRLRKTIAKRLVEAQHNAAILTTFNEIDMSNLMALRKKYKDAFKEKHGVNLGFMGFFVKATIEALKAYPAVNAMIDGDDLVYNNTYNIGIAVSTDKGLLVPVVRNAEHLSLAEIELSIRHYALKARDGKVAIDDLADGTFTITNGGVFGSLMSTPILNPPQSGILGMHKIEERPMAINGEVKIRPMMYVALSYDHRVIDGKQSVGFLVRIKECIEDPSRILMDI